MRQNNLISAVFIILMAMTVVVPALADDTGITREELDIENSIIIRELKMDSEEPQKEVSPRGTIYFDDNFGDASVVKGSKRKARQRSRRVAKKKNNQSLLLKLQKKDRRWHLSSYRVRRGDNLWKIAAKHGISHRLIMKFNDLSNPDFLKPGSLIRVPNRSGVYHRVRRGDTLSVIAKRYRGEVKTIRRQNHIRGSRILRGDKIFIPDGRKPCRRSVARKKITRRKLQVAKRNRVEKPERRVSRPGFYWPVRGRITSGFGTRRDPLSGKRRFHCGIDISANEGTPVRASAGGKVIYSGWKHGYGKVVILRHRGGYISVYAHNSKNIVQKNDTVKRGSMIARSGMTGAVTGAHLHFEIRKYVTPLNPLRLLR